MKRGGVGWEEEEGGKCGEEGHKRKVCGEVGG